MFASQNFLWLDPRLRGNDGANGLFAMKLSVAMCTYNGERFVAEQLRSILEQSRKVDEIVVSDDGSSDGTLERVRDALAAFPGQAPELKILTGERLGIVRNFSRAVGACTGDIIFLSDQDDVWLPSKVGEMISVFGRDPGALLACSDAHLVDGNLAPLGRSQFQMVRMTDGLRRSLEGHEGFEVLLRRNVVTGATVAFRRELLGIALPFSDCWLHDEWLAIMAAAKGGLRLVDKPLVLYRQHGSNQCGMKPEPLSAQLVQASVKAPEYSGARRIRQVMERLGSSGSRRIAHLESALAFEEKRSRLPSSRISRAFSIGMMAGKYWRHADGARSALKDMLARR